MTGSWWWHGRRCCRRNGRRLGLFTHEGDEIPTDISNRLVVELAEDPLVELEVEVLVVVRFYAPLSMDRY
jgi:hypothetical protein